MQPTIYKPSIYNGNGVYNNGASGGGYEKYILSIDDFNITTLNDNGVQWFCNNKNNLSKTSDYLQLNANGNISWLYLVPYYYVDSLFNKLTIEFEVEFTNSNWFYARLYGRTLEYGQEYFVSAYENGLNNNSYMVTSTTDVNLYRGDFDVSFGTYGKRYNQAPYISNQKNKVKFIVGIDKKIEIYINDELCLDYIFPLDLSYVLNSALSFDNGANEGIGLIKLYSLKIEYE